MQAGKWRGRTALLAGTAAAGALLLAGGAGYALAAGRAPATNLYGCVSAGRAVNLSTTRQSACPRGAAAFHVGLGARGPQGPAGPPGADAPVTATGATAVSQRDVAGNHGNWAVAQFNRVVTVTRHGQVPAVNCPTGSVVCWFYTATMVDAGGFSTDPGARSPNVGGAISGTVMGTLTGGSHIEFYADVPAPSASSVPGIVTGDTPADAAWMSYFFPTGKFSAPVFLDQRVTYTAPRTCEQWVNSRDNQGGSLPGAGDITGVNAC